MDNLLGNLGRIALLATVACGAPFVASARAQAPRNGYYYYYPRSPQQAQAGPYSRGYTTYYYPQSYSYPQQYTAMRPATYAAPAQTQAAPAQASAETRQASQAQATPTQAPTGDPYGFTNWLNATRARYGLAPVGYDPNLASWAATNNAHQLSRGLGHFVMGPARRQNCAMGNSASIGAMWMNSPAHRANMLASDIRWIGLSGSGQYWTLNAF
jgi:uncharacterized protein YkwD